MEIPYTITPRRDTGLYNAKLGIWLFLASEVMLFGALFSTLILLRTSSPNWPHGWDILNVPLATLNTFVLISSSVTVIMAWASLRLGDLRKGRIYLALTLGCGFGFLIIKAIEYTTKFQHHLYPSKHNFYATYYVMTGLHGLHVLIGIGIFIWMFVKAQKGVFGPNYFGPIDYSALYWHLVDLIWIYLFPLLYLIH